MAILLKTHKMLWGRSGNCCAFENCRKHLVTDISETDGDVSVVGEEAHIVAREFEGPRGSNNLDVDLRDKYSNLILLCHDHHKIIDDYPDKFTAEMLLTTKTNHENWVKSNLDFDNVKGRDDERYASYIDEILKMLHIENWEHWANDFITEAVQRLSTEIHEQLTSLPGFIRSRIWPKRYQSLEEALHNIAYVTNDLLFIFDEHSKESTDGKRLMTERFYKIEQFPQEVYDRLLKEYQFHVSLIRDLMLELTRALNMVFDLVRSFLFPSFRIIEGALMLNDNANYNLLMRPEYIGEQRQTLPYKGYKEFMYSRSTRDRHFGQGYSKQYE